MTPGIPNPDHRPDGDPDCPLCRGEGYACEDHPDLPWHHVNGDTDGAGVNCPRCNPREKDAHEAHR